MTAPDERRLLTAAQTADWLQVSERTLRRWRAGDSGPRCVRFGTGAAGIRYRTADVAAWLELHADDLPAPVRRVGRPRRVS